MQKSQIARSDLKTPSAFRMIPLFLGFGVLCVVCSQGETEKKVQREGSNGKQGQTTSPVPIGSPDSQNRGGDISNTPQPDSSARTPHPNGTLTPNPPPFGEADHGQQGLVGKVVRLPNTTTQLPNFDLLPTSGVIVASNVDTSARDWVTGFPEVGDLHEWFGIQFQGTITFPKEGWYQFKIYSDDGSKLLIKNQLVIDNDGLHSPMERYGAYYATGNLKQKIEVQYFQGPRWGIALQLFWIPPSGSDFTIVPSGALHRR
jgi:hypothetical protein